MAALLFFRVSPDLSIMGYWRASFNSHLGLPRRPNLARGPEFDTPALALFHSKYNILNKHKRTFVERLIPVCGQPCFPGWVPIQYERLWVDRIRLHGRGSQGLDVSSGTSLYPNSYLRQKLTPTTYLALLGWIYILKFNYLSLFIIITY